LATKTIPHCLLVKAFSQRGRVGALVARGRMDAKMVKFTFLAKLEKRGKPLLVARAFEGGFPFDRGGYFTDYCNSVIYILNIFIV
jgi:hypothetical protein